MKVVITLQVGAWQRVHNVFRSAGEANKRRFIYSAFAATHTLTLPQTCFAATHRLRCKIAAAECAKGVSESTQDRSKQGLAARVGGAVITPSCHWDESFRRVNDYRKTNKQYLIRSVSGTAGAKHMLQVTLVLLARKAHQLMGPAFAVQESVLRQCLARPLRPACLRNTRSC